MSYKRTTSHDESKTPESGRTESFNHSMASSTTSSIFARSPFGKSGEAEQD